MRSKVAGAALTAVMACAGIGQAEAALISLSTEGELSFPLPTYAGYVDGTLTYELKFDTDHPSQGTFKTSSNYYGQDANGNPTVEQYFASSTGSINITLRDAGNDYYYFSVSGNAVYDYSNMPTATSNTSFSGAFWFENDAATMGHAYVGNTYGSVTSTGGHDLTLSEVPLPASAPMFGAALLALGGAGYARRRSRSA